MKTRTTNPNLKRALAMSLCVVMFAAPVLAQGGGKPGIKTDSRMLYHNGPVMQGSPNVYLIWYGNWSNSLNTIQLLTTFLIGLATSQYFQINVGYPDALGNAPNGSLIYSGTRDDTYSQGTALSIANIEEIVAEKIRNGWLPLDGGGIYLVLGSADVSASETGFCSLNNQPPHHGLLDLNGAPVKYAFIGNPRRCPSLAAPHLNFPGPTPNNDYAADGMANTMAAVLSAIVTNPHPGFGWFDRYGLENSTKCRGTFGQTYSTPNGATANLELAGPTNWLIQQNWVNTTRKGYCALAPPQP
jgi:hypothetical protein